MISVHSLTRALRSFLQLVAALGVLIWGADVALAQCTNNNPDSDGDGVCNNTDVDDDGLAAELDYLRREIYQRDADPPVTRFGARDRFSTRV